MTINIISPILLNTIELKYEFTKIVFINYVEKSCKKLKI